MILSDVCLHTNDVIGLATFYKTILKIQDEKCEDATHQFIITNGTTLSIYNDGNPKNNQNENISLAFTVDDVGVEYQRLKEIGVKFVSIPKLQPWGATNMCFLDPDGNKVFFRSFTKEE